MAFDLRTCVVRVESLDGRYIVGCVFVIIRALTEILFEGVTYGSS